MFDDIDPDAVVDARDDSFDDDWIRAAESVEAAWQDSPDQSKHAPAIDRVREAAFKRTFNGSGGNHELAAIVSDDFEIICKRTLLGTDSPFIVGLETAYNAHQIPQ